MKEDEILAMETGYDLNVRVATEVMGIRFPTVEEMQAEAQDVWREQPNCRHFMTGFEAWQEDGNFQWRYVSKRYSTDIAAAWEVSGRMHKKLFSKRKRFLDELQKMTALEDGRYIAWPDVFWTITPERICKSALLTVLPQAIGTTEDA